MRDELEGTREHTISSEEPQMSDQERDERREQILDEMDSLEEKKLHENLDMNMELIEIQKKLGEKENPELVKKTEELQDQLLRQEGSIEDMEDYKNAQQNGDSLTLEEKPNQSLKSDGTGQTLIDSPVPMNEDAINNGSEMDTRDELKDPDQGSKSLVRIV